MAEKQTNEIVIKLQSYNRQPKDLSHWKQALVAAEDPDYPDFSPLMNLYHDIMLDGHLTAVTEKRILKILNAGLVYSEDGKENELVDNLMDSEAFEQLLRNIIESRLYGHSLSWIDITLPGQKAPEVDLIDRRHIVPPLHIYKYRDSDNNNAGIDYTETPLYNYILSTGRKKDLGLLLKCAPYVLLKRGDVSDWATFAEVFGMPLRKGTYPAHNPQARKELLEAMDEMGAASSVAVPDGSNIEFVQNTTSTSGKGIHECFADWCDKQISKTILTNTLTTDAEGGKYKGDIHAESENEVTKADLRFVLRVLNDRFTELLELHGYKPNNGKFKLPEQETSPGKDVFEVDKGVSEIVEVDPEFFYEKYNIPIPKGGAKLKQPKEPVAKKQELSAQDIVGLGALKKRISNFFD